ncbi:MAG: NAD(P)H-quinone oxidoreductase subunit F, partial [Cyanobacteria bacterium J06639_18]
LCTPSKPFLARLIGILLLVNGLTALNLTRFFRLVFWGKPQPKTRRAPEVHWPMALPMVSLTIVTLLVPVMLQQWYLLPTLDSINWYVASSLFGSSLLGVAIGSKIYLHKAWSRSRLMSWRMVQDLLGYDFYIDKIYRVTIVSVVGLLSNISAWCDRYLVDGFVNLVGIATVFGGQSLRYSVSGRSQGYLLTILVGISILGIFLSWSLGLLDNLPF